MRGEPKRPSGSSRKRAAQSKRKVPPYGRRSHRVTHAQARRMREKYLRRYKGVRAPLQAGVYDRAIFDKILAQKGCKGVRFYPGIDDDGKMTVLFAGVDGEGNDMLAGIIGDMPFRCPPYCSSANGVLAF